MGFGWYIFCELVYFSVEDRNSQLTEEEMRYTNSETFFSRFRFEDRDDLSKAIVVVYYAFTSLSTVGFGDYHPRSDEERMLCAFILLFGVAIFSYIMGVFIEILQQYNSLFATIEEGDELAKFFGIIRNFNNDKAMEPELKLKIEKHLDYKWKHDRNSAIDESDER